MIKDQQGECEQTILLHMHVATLYIANSYWCIILAILAIVTATIKWVIFMRCKEGSWLVKISATQCSFDYRFYCDYI